MLERMAPEKLKMPSGSMAAVDYTTSEEPVVKVMAFDMPYCCSGAISGLRKAIQWAGHTDESISKVHIGLLPMQVKIQEVFGLPQTPSIADGAVPVLLHLLSPAQKPIQVTRDLSSFWNDQYIEVAKELRGRYPKHFWPESPIEAEATRKTKKQMDREAKSTSSGHC